MNLDLMCQTTLSHQRQLLDQAAQRRMLHTPTPTRPWRGGGRSRVADFLRRLADRLDSGASHPRIALLRAVAHHEIDVDQAMRLLGSNGYRSTSQ